MTRPIPSATIVCLLILGMAPSRAKAAPTFTIDGRPHFTYTAVNRAHAYNFTVSLFTLGEKNEEVPVPVGDVTSQVYTVDADDGGVVKSVSIDGEVATESGATIGGFVVEFSADRRMATLTKKAGNADASFALRVVVKHSTTGRKLLDVAGKVKVKGMPGVLTADAHVTIDVIEVLVKPVTSGTNIQLGDCINSIQNPSGIPILYPDATTRDLQIDGCRAAEIVAQVNPDKGPLFRPRLIQWQIRNVDRNGRPEFAGDRADFVFRSTPLPNTGTMVKVYGSNQGRIRMNVFVGRDIEAAAFYEALVEDVRDVPCRVQLFNPGAGGTRFSAEQVAEHIQFANFYLRQVGVRLVPDTNDAIAANARAVPNRPGFFIVLFPMLNSTSARTRPSRQQANKTTVQACLTFATRRASHQRSGITRVLHIRNQPMYLTLPQAMTTRHCD